MNIYCQIKTRVLIAIALMAGCSMHSVSQINADQVMRIGQNTLFFEDYVLSIQYFNQAISAKPYLAQPYFFRAIAKLNLDDYQGAESDATLAIERNPFITDAYEVRGVARQNMGRHREAVADYDKALESAPYSRGLLFNKAIALSEMKEYGSADSTFILLLRHHPGFDGGYIGRARLSLERGDTASAVSAVEKALEVNPNSVNAYVLRADIAMNSHRDFASARDDMDQAIKLQPHVAGFFINRAFLRYNLDDYYGAMADYDYALQLEPSNTTALFNRALLRAEVHDTNNAIDDLNEVLRLRHNDYRSLFNRALLYKEIGAYDEAVADLDRLIDAFPDFAAAYFLRFDVRRERGDRSADSDYKKSLSLAKKRVGIDRDTFLDVTTLTDDKTVEQTQEEVEARFTSLITVNDNLSSEEIYNNKNIKGKVQDRNVSVELEPMFSVVYYNSPTELKPGGEYVREVADLNDTRMLKFQLQVTNHESRRTDSDVFELHTASADEYADLFANGKGRPIDYLGRAMDYMTLRDYDRAIDDLDEAIKLSPDFTIAYIVRADARFHRLEIVHDADSDPRLAYNMIIADLDEAIKLSPRMAIAYYNKGVVFAEMQDFTSALTAFNSAISLKPEFGEAYFNRGYVYLRLGNRDKGVADLSKAGELGVVSSYNLLKRMTR